MTVITSPHKYPSFEGLSLLSKLEKDREIRPLWVSGCYRSGKTAVIEHVAHKNRWSIIKIEPPQKNQTFYRRTIIHHLSAWVREVLEKEPKVSVEKTLEALEMESIFLDSVEEELLKYIKDSCKPVLWLVVFNDLTNKQWVDSVIRLYNLVRKKTDGHNPYLMLECWERRNKFYSRSPVDEDTPTTKTFVSDENINSPLQFDDVAIDVALNKEESTMVSDRWFDVFLDKSIQEYNEWAFFKTDESGRKNFREAVREWAGNHYGANNLIYKILKQKHDWIKEKNKEEYSAQIKKCVEWYYHQESPQDISNFIKKLQVSCKLDTFIITNLKEWEKDNLIDIGLINKEDEKFIKLVSLSSMLINGTENKETDKMTETALAVMSALQLVKWLSPGVGVASKKVGEAVGDVLAQKLKELFDVSGESLGEISQEQEKALVERASNTLSSPSFDYSDEQLLQDVQRTLIKLLQSNNDYTDDDIFSLYETYVDPLALRESLTVRYTLDPRGSIAKKIVQQATVDRCLPKLIQDMRKSIK